MYQSLFGSKLSHDGVLEISLENAIWGTFSNYFSILVYFHFEFRFVIDLKHNSTANFVLAAFERFSLPSGANLAA